MSQQAAQKVEDKPQVGSMTEAGFSMNVKMIDPQGQEVMLTFRCALASNADKLIDHYSHITNLLTKANWQPVKAGAKASQDNAQPAASGTPTCPVHGSAMRASQHGGHYCSKKLADGSYCKAKG